MHVQGNAVVHYGHTCFSKANIPVFLVLPKRELNVETTMKNFYESFNSDSNVRFCLFYDAEFEHSKGKGNYSCLKYLKNSSCHITLCLLELC